MGRVEGSTTGQVAAGKGASAPVLNQNTDPKALTAAVVSYIEAEYVRAAAPNATPAQQKIFTTAPAEKTILNPTKPVSIPPFVTNPQNASNTPQFAGKGDGHQSVTFNGGMLFFTKDGKHMWFNTEGGTTPSFGKATSGLWYGPIPTGK